MHQWLRAMQKLRHIFWVSWISPPHVMKTPNTNVPANVSNLCTLRWQWYMYRKYLKETPPMSPTRQKVGLSLPHFDYVIFARSPIACIRWLVWFVRYICWLKKCPIIATVLWLLTLLLKCNTFSDHLIMPHQLSCPWTIPGDNWHCLISWHPLISWYPLVIYRWVRLPAIGHFVCSTKCPWYGYFSAQVCAGTSFNAKRGNFYVYQTTECP